MEQDAIMHGEVEVKREVDDETMLTAATNPVTDVEQPSRIEEPVQPITVKLEPDEGTHN